MKLGIKRAAVIGAGVMGASIAAHLVNIGIETYLFDIVPTMLNKEECKKGLELTSHKVRNRLSINAINSLKKAKPSPLYLPEYAELIIPANLEDHMGCLSRVDWICECVVEDIEVKKALFRNIMQYIEEGTILSTNTSGLSIQELADSMPQKLKENFLGVHFFNPPRYMKLLEITPCQQTRNEVIKYMTCFGERIMGKGVVLAKDTPNFIANRIGIFNICIAMKKMVEAGLSIEEMDALTGKAIGRPASATFQLADLVGLDTMVHVMKNMYDSVTEHYEKQIFEVPDWLQKMVDNGWNGVKAQKGFYMKAQKGDKSSLEVMELETMSYRPVLEVRFDSLERAGAAEDVSGKLKALITGSDIAAETTWSIIKAMLLYSADMLGVIADDITAIDNSMKWGFNWKLGPFETWDALGVDYVVGRLKEEGDPIPEAVKALLASGGTSFYQSRKDGIYYFDPSSMSFLLKREIKESIRWGRDDMAAALKSNDSASIIDVGDGVLCLELHSPKQAIDLKVIEMLENAQELLAGGYKGMVIASQGNAFCTGANIKLIMEYIERKDWNGLQYLVKRMQNVLLSMKYSEKPIAAAPFGLTLGGGAEICLHTAKIRASAETYMGLVEVGIGLIPAGGGTKELLMRSMEGIDDINTDAQPFVKRAFEAIALAKISSSAYDAGKMGFLRRGDGITVCQEKLIYDANQSVIAMCLEGYRPPRPVKVRALGEPGLAGFKAYIWSMFKGEYISEHDMKVLSKAAYVLCGGQVPRNTQIEEQYLLDLEGEAFLSLCGEAKTQERMNYMLQKGKPLRN